MYICIDIDRSSYAVLHMPAIIKSCHINQIEQALLETEHNVMWTEHPLIFLESQNSLHCTVEFHDN